MKLTEAILDIGTKYRVYHILKYEVLGISYCGESVFENINFVTISIQNLYIVKNNPYALICEECKKYSEVQIELLKYYGE
jgi:hypothetical protein